MTLSDLHAVLIGVTSYKDPSFLPLPCAAFDVRELERTLESHLDGSPNFFVAAQVADENTLWTAGDLLDAIDRDLENCEHFLFYFSGHGVVNQYGLQLATPDKEHPLDSGVYFDTLLRRFNQATTTEVTIILDCCFSGGAGDWSADAAGPLKNSIHIRDGITILASSGREERSFGSDASPSAFTREIVACLDRDDVNSINALDLYAWTREKVTGQTPVIRTSGSKLSPIRAESATAAREISAGPQQE